MKKTYLSIILLCFGALTSLLFLQKSNNLKKEAVKEELQKSLVRYLEREEVYPDKLDDIKVNFRKLKIRYEVLDDGQSCRYWVEDELVELWSSL